MLAAIDSGAEFERSSGMKTSAMDVSVDGGTAPAGFPTFIWERVVGRVLLDLRHTGSNICTWLETSWTDGG